MTTWLVMVIMLMAGMMLQMYLPGFALLGQVKFPVLLAVALYYALNWDIGVTLVAAFCAGFLQDALSPLPMGYSAFCFCAMCLAINRWRSLIMTESFLAPAFFGAIASMTVTLVLYILLLHAEKVVPSFGRLVLRLIGSGILGAIVTPVVFGCTDLLDRLVGNREERNAVDGLN